MVDGVGTTHHVKIGDDFHLIRPNGYRKQAAPLFGARFTTGDPDYNTLNLWQYWVQRCWIGGFSADDWQDDSMYDEGVGVDGSQHDVLVLARDLGPVDRVGGAWDLDEAGQVRSREFIQFNNKLYCLSHGDTDNDPPGRLFRYNETLGTWSGIRTFTERVRSMAVWGGYLVFGDGGNDLTRMTTGEAFDTFAKPAAGNGITPYALLAFRDRLYVPFGREIWRLKPDWTWDGSTAFYVAEGVNYINHAEVHLGFAYFASQDGHILRTDGNNTFDLWAFEPFVKIWGIRSFDGRLFIGAGEDLDGTASAEAVIYQFSGAAVTELKRWGKVGVDVTPGRLRAVGHRLMFGASSLLGMGDGFGIASYDPREDAYHAFASNRDTVSYPGGTEGANWRVDDVFFYKGHIFCSVAGYGIFRTTLSYKDVTRFEATYDTTAIGELPGSENGGWLKSSEFDAGTPGLLKLFDAITIHVDLPTTACTVYVEYSTDGQTWAHAGTAEKTGAATRYASTFRLMEAGVPVTGTRIKYRITLRTTDSTRTPQVRGVVVRFLPIPEPNWKWELGLVLSDEQQLLDGSVSTPDVAGKLASLEGAFRTQLPIHFTDIDGTEWGAGAEKLVLLQDLREDVRYIGPASDGVIERDVTVTLLEVKDSYEEVS